MTLLFWIAIGLFVVVAGGLSLDWYRVNRREKLKPPNTWRTRRDEYVSTAHLARSFELKAAKGTDRAPKLVPQADRRKDVH